MIDFKCIDKIIKKLKRKYPNIQANTYGYANNVYYDKYHKKINNNDFVKTMLFKGGFDPHFNEETNSFCTGESVELWYHFTEYNAKEIIKMIKGIVNSFGYILEVEEKNAGSMYICENKDAVERLYLPF